MIGLQKNIPNIGGFSVHQHCSILQFHTPLNCISNAPWLGGSSNTIKGVINLKVSETGNTDEIPTIEQTFVKACRDNQLTGRFVGLMTAASMKSFRFSTKKFGDFSMVCAVTAGLANARRIGDTADFYETTVEKLPAGTINIVFATNAPLSATAQLEAFALITEAKTAACYDANILSFKSNKMATGTGTDATVVASAIEADNDLLIPYCGKHTHFGEQIGSVAYESISATIQGCLDCL